MTEYPSNGHLVQDAAPGAETERPCRWGETVAGLIPFLFTGVWSVALALLAFPPPLWQLVACVGPLVAGYVAMLVGLGVGWARGFPRWSYGYVCLVPLFSLYAAIAGYSTIVSRAYVLCVPLFGALMPLAAVAAVALAVTRSLQPLIRLATQVWRDWTRLSFAVYGLFPMLVWLAFDEVEDRYALPLMIALMAILAGGAVAYLRSAQRWQRAISLLTATIFARVGATVVTVVYWNTHPEPWMTGPPVGWGGIAGASVASSVFLLTLLFAPALLGLLRRWVGSPRAAV